VREPADYDLTKTPAEKEAAPGLSIVGSQPYNPAQDREKLRGKIALVLVVILGFIVVSAVVFVFINPVNGLGAMKPVLDVLLAPIVGLVGAVTGFYFGEKAK
jgi:hypothetical protein